LISFFFYSCSSARFFVLFYSTNGKGGALNMTMNRPKARQHRSIRRAVVLRVRVESAARVSSRASFLLSALSVAALSAVSTHAIAAPAAPVTSQSAVSQQSGLGQGLGQSQSAGAGLQWQPTPTTWRATFESWKVSDDERMGMLGLNLLFDVHPNIKLGFGSYGALTGDRGGFITLGLVSELQMPLDDHWVLRGGVYAGAGGGAGGYELAGGGFMFRADGGITYKLGRWGNIGAGISWVTFPTGQIRSAQPYIMYEYPFYSAASPGWSSAAASKTNQANQASPTLPGLSSRRQEFSIGWTGYKIPSSVSNSSGGPQNSSMQLAGTRWNNYLDDRWYLTFQADGAFAGDSAGYMQILGGLGYRLPLGSRTGLKVFGSLGPAGGGGVATGGGLLYSAGIALQQMITDNWAIELGVGGVKAGTGDFKAWSMGLNLSYIFGTPNVSKTDTLSSRSLSGYQISPLRVRVMNQTYLKANDQWRTQDVNTSVNNLGFALDYFWTPKLYLTGQGLAAYSGSAGAYMTGLLGAGVQQPVSERWFVMAEGLVGAAGGGTMATGNGSIWQVNAGIGYRLTDNLSVMLTGGHMQAPTGNFTANVVGVSMGYRFGLPTLGIQQ